MAHLPTAYESIPVPYDTIIYIYIYTYIPFDLTWADDRFIVLRNLFAIRKSSTRVRIIIMINNNRKKGN